jgi:hypothetical protein
MLVFLPEILTNRDIEMGLIGLVFGSATFIFGRLFLKHNHDKQTTRTRITFFILGSGENSFQLRKRLLELANEKISKELAHDGIEFTMQEPMIYVESPVTI